jgi:hypothetical protein
MHAATLLTWRWRRVPDALISPKLAITAYSIAVKAIDPLQSVQLQSLNILY